MVRFVVKRLLWLIPISLAAVTLIFFLMSVVPGDVAQFILGSDRAPDPVQLQTLRTQLGLDRPLYQQYLSWLWGIVHLDLGKSLWTGAPVASEIWIRLPYTMTLTFMALTISVVLAIPIGIVAALKQDTAWDYGLRIFTISGLSIPSFWFATLIVLFLLSVFSWSVPLTYAPVYSKPGMAMQQLIFPALALGYRQTAVSARMMRSSMLEVMEQDYLRTARSKGLKENTVTYVHALKNAVIPVLSIFAVEAIVLFSGAVIVERIFNIPGIGRLLVDAITRRDVPLVQGTVLLMVVVVALVNLATDVIYAWLDPRITYK